MRTETRSHLVGGIPADVDQQSVVVRPSTRNEVTMFLLPDVEDARLRFRRDGHILVEHSLMPSAAISTARLAEAAVRSSARRIDHRDEGSRLAYSVVTGDHIMRDAPLLFSLYTSPTLLTWVRRVTDCPSVARSPETRSAININCLTRRGEEYPLHLDAVPYTAVLFLSDVEAHAGGHFVIHSLRGGVFEIQPTLGHLVLMDGAACRHGVMPLRRDAWRLTMPMVFPARHTARPDGLDDFLYGVDHAPRLER
jgi:hypothetical protein